MKYMLIPLICILTILILGIKISAQVSSNSLWSFRGGGSEVVRGTKGVPSSNNTPGDRNGSIKFEDPVNGKLYLYGGNGIGGFQFGDLWMFDANTEEWTWISGSDQPATRPVYNTRGAFTNDGFPGARFESFGWFDPNNNCLWLYGGGTPPGSRCDMWRFDLSAKLWSWVAGDTIVNPPAYWRDLDDQNRLTPGGVSTGVAWYVYNNRHPNQSYTGVDLGAKLCSKLFLFGGYSNAGGQRQTIMVFTTDDNKWWFQDPGDGCVEINGQPSCPTAREGSVGWQQTESNWNDPDFVKTGIRYTAEREALYMGGGYGWGRNGKWGYLTDVWKYDVLRNRWTYISGSMDADISTIPTDHPFIAWKNMSTQNNSHFYVMGPMGNGIQRIWTTNYPAVTSWNKIYEGFGMVNRPRYEQSNLVKPDLGGNKTVWYAKNRLFLFSLGRVWAYFDPCTNVSISASKLSINPGDTVVFTASTNADALTYQWRKNGQDIPGAIDKNYSSWSLAHNDKITCIATMAAGCIDGKKVINISNELTITWPVPQNDLICNAIEVQMNSTPICTEMTAATTSGETSICRSPLKTVWYKYTPLQSGWVKVKLGGAAPINNPGGFVGIYFANAGSCPNSLQVADSTALFGSNCQLWYNGLSNPARQWSAMLSAGKTYYFMVSFVNSTSTGALCFSIEDAPPPPVSCCAPLLYPINGADSVPTFNILKWAPVEGATHYDVYVSQPDNPESYLKRGQVNATQFITNLLPNSTYSWFVLPNALGVLAPDSWGNYQIQSFKTGAAPPNDLPSGAFALIKNAAPICMDNRFATNTNEPISGATCGGTNTNSVWTKYTPIITERVQLNYGPLTGKDTLIGFMGIFTDVNQDGQLEDSTRTLLNITTCGTTNTNIAQRHGLWLRAGVTYYFRFTGQNDIGNVCVSITDVENPPATCTPLFFPTANQTEVNHGTLVWRKLPEATHYRIYLGKESNPPLVATVADTIYKSGNLTPNTQYNWYVVPINVGGASENCQQNIQSFITSERPANDGYCNAIPIQPDGISLCANNGMATNTGDIPGQCYGATNTLWYKFSPQHTMEYIMTLETSQDAFRGNLWLGAFVSESGNCVQGNLPLADSTLTLFGTCQFVFNNPIYPNPNLWRVTLQAGKNYFFRISGIGTDVGNFCLNMQTANVFTLKDGNWYDPSVWSNGMVPLPQTRVTIASKITLTNSVSCLSLKLMPGAELNIADGINLTITE